MLAGDRVSGTDADRHDDTSRNGSSGFRGIADSAEMGGLGDLISDYSPVDQKLISHSASAASNKMPSSRPMRT